MTGGRDRRRRDRRRPAEGESTPSVPWWERRYGQEPDTAHGAGADPAQSPPDATAPGGPAAGGQPGAGQPGGPGDGRGVDERWARPTGEHPQADLDVSALRQSAGTGGYRGDPRQADPRQGDPRQADPWQGDPRQADPRQGEAPGQPPPGRRAAQPAQPAQPAYGAGQPPGVPAAPGQPATGDHPRTTGDHPRATGEHPRATGEHPRATGEQALATGDYPRGTGEHHRASGEYPAHRPDAAAEDLAAPAAAATATRADEPGRVDGERARERDRDRGGDAERTTGTHSRVPARTRRFTVPSLRVRPLDLQVLTWWVLTRVSLLVVAVSAPSVFYPESGQPGQLERWGNWDVAHFVEIAQHGYFREAWETPVEAFFPGLPLIMRLGVIVGISPVLVGLVVSLLAGAVAAVALARLAESEYGEGTGQKAALAWMIAPPGVFLAAPYTEALFLGFAIPAWLAARRGHWWLAGVLTMAACTVRVSGLFLLIALGVEFLTSRRRGSWENAGWLALPLLPLLAYNAFLWVNTGDPLRWYTAQGDNWYRSFHWPWDALLTTVQAAQGEGFQASSPAMQANWEWMFRVELVAMLLGVVLTVVLLTLNRWSEATWVGLQVAAFSTSMWFFSVPRATLLWFPLWIGLGALSRTHPWVWRGYVAVAAPLFGLWAAAFIVGKWAG